LGTRRTLEGLFAGARATPMAFLEPDASVACARFSFSLRVSRSAPRLPWRHTPERPDPSLHNSRLMRPARRWVARKPSIRSAPVLARGNYRASRNFSAGLSVRFAVGPRLSPTNGSVLIPEARGSQISEQSLPRAAVGRYPRTVCAAGWVVALPRSRRPLRARSPGTRRYLFDCDLLGGSVYPALGKGPAGLKILSGYRDRCRSPLAPQRARS